MHLCNRKRLMTSAMVLSALTVLLLFPCTGHAALYHFGNIAGNSAVDAAIGEAQLAVDVT